MTIGKGSSILSVIILIKLCNLIVSYMTTVIHVNSIYLMTHLFNTPSHLFRTVFFNKKYTYNKTSPQRSPLKQRPLGLVPEKGY